MEFLIEWPLFVLEFALFPAFIECSIACLSDTKWSAKRFASIVPACVGIYHICLMALKAA